jgi:hypothetical protein
MDDLSPIAEKANPEGVPQDCDADRNGLVATVVIAAIGVSHFARGN